MTARVPFYPGVQSRIGAQCHSFSPPYVLSYHLYLYFVTYIFFGCLYAIYAGSIVIFLDAGYRGDAEDFQPERQLIWRLLYSPTGLSTFSPLELYTIGLLSKKNRPFSF